MEPDRPLDRHQSQCDEQHHRLRAARLRQRLQDADGRQLCRHWREHHHQRGAWRSEFGCGPDHHQRRQRHRHDALDDQERRRAGGADDGLWHSDRRRRPTAERSPPTPSRSPTRRSSAATSTRSKKPTTTGISSPRRRRRRPNRACHDSQIQNSVNNVAKAQQSQIITNRVLGSILLGATEQVSCSSCGSGFGSIGSLALGAHGRWPLSDQLTAMGGFSYNQWSSAGITVYDAPTFAGSLVYDLVQLGQQPAIFRGRRRAHALRAGQILPQPTRTV